MTTFNLPFDVHEHPWYGYYWKGMEIGSDHVADSVYDLDDAINTANDYLRRLDHYHLSAALHVGVVHGIEASISAHS